MSRSTNVANDEVQNNVKGGEVSGSSKNHVLPLTVPSQWQSEVLILRWGNVRIMMVICRDDSPFKLERASPPPSSDLSHPLLSSNLPTSSSSHSAYNPIWSPASISPNANDLMSGPGSGMKVNVKKLHRS